VLDKGRCRVIEAKENRLPWKKLYEDSKTTPRFWRNRPALRANQRFHPHELLVVIIIIGHSGGLVAAGAGPPPKPKAKTSSVEQSPSASIAWQSYVGDNNERSPGIFPATFRLLMGAIAHRAQNPQQPQFMAGGARLLGWVTARTQCQSG